MKIDDIKINYKTGPQKQNLVSKNLAPSNENITQPNGGKLLLHQSTVTLTARMWPPIEEAEPPSNIFLGLPFIVWGIIIGCGIIFLLILATLFFYFYLLPRQHKYLSQTPFGSHHNHNTISSSSIGTAKNSYSSSSIGRLGEPNNTMASQQQQQQHQQQQTHHHNHHHNNMQNKYHQQHQQIPQQHQYHQQPHHHYQPSSASLMMINGEIYHQTVNCSGHCINNLINSQNPQISSSNNRINTIHDQQTIQADGSAIASSQCNLQQSSSAHCIPETHKSMWAVNSFYDSNQEISDQQSNYRTRSLPSWGKNGKQRPASTVDDLEELYAQVNFTKKRRNRMRNDNAAIIARCRSRSQNLTSLHLESEGIVVYDERTAL